MTGRSVGGDRGSVTAEFALAMPAIAIVLAASVGGVGAAVEAVRLQHAASTAARDAGRGGGTDVARRLAPEASVARWSQGDLECVELSARAAVGPVSLPLTATACALGGGR